jgi:hypothetical protein
MSSHKRFYFLAAVVAFSIAAAAPVPTTKPSPQEMLAQAVEFMRKGQMQKARPLLEELGKSLPANEQTRPYVLNRAIVDVALKANAMRAVRELGDYLIRHRDADEEATNILGAALDLTARDPKLKAGKLWQTAFREWDRRNYELENSRPGYHRFAAKWLTQEQFDDLKDQREKIEKAIKDKEELAQRADWRAGSSRMESDQAKYAVNTLSNAIGDDYNLTDYQRLRGRQRAGATITLTPSIGPYRQGWEIARDEVVANQAVEYRRAEQERLAAVMEADHYRLEINQLRAKQPRPVWPTTFEPVELTALLPPALPPPDPKAAAALAQKNGQIGNSWMSAFGDPNAAVLPAAGAAANPATMPTAIAPPTPLAPPTPTTQPIFAPPVR